jgi:hypothetical protein
MKYLSSTKNLAGSAAGLLGIVLYLIGAVGSYWPVVVIGLYGAAALLAPADRVRLLQSGSSLRADVASLMARTDEHSGRMPAGAAAQVRRIGEVLTGILDRPLAADPDIRHRVTRLAQVDLPLSIESYLNVPWWFARKDGRAAGELLTQLNLLETEAHRIAERVYADDIQQQADHTRYLRGRAEDPGQQ